MKNEFIILKRLFFFYLKLLIVFLLLIPFLAQHASGQIVSPLQGGHCSPAIKNIRDRATQPPGLFIVWYNIFVSSNNCFDRDGKEFNSINLNQILPILPDISVDINMKAFVSLPVLFWACPVKLLDGQNWQVNNDYGDAVYWDPIFHDRKSSLLFSAGYRAWKEGLNFSFKYGFDNGLRQRFKNNFIMLDITNSPKYFTGKT